jgi:hypothetical protein
MPAPEGEGKALAITPIWNKIHCDLEPVAESVLKIESDGACDGLHYPVLKTRLAILESWRLAYRKRQTIRHRILYIIT